MARKEGCGGRPRTTLGRHRPGSPSLVKHLKFRHPSSSHPARSGASPARASRAAAFRDRNLPLAAVVHQAAGGEKGPGRGCGEAHGLADWSSQVPARPGS